MHVLNADSVICIQTLCGTEHVTLGRTAHHLQDLVCMRDLHAWLAAAPARVDTVGCKHIWFLEPRTVLRGLQST